MGRAVQETTAGSRREKVRRALRHEPGPVPFQLNLDKSVGDQLRGRGIPVDRWISDSDVVWVGLKDPFRAPIGDDAWVDQFGVAWRRSGTSGAAHPVGVSATIDPSNPILPACEDARRLDPIRKELAEGRDAFTIAMWRGPFEVAGFICTMPGLLGNLATDPVRASRLLGALTDFQTGLIDQVARTGVDAILIGDDYGAQRGLLVSPGMWRRLLRPHLQQLVDRVHAHGLPFALHSDGNVAAIVPDLVAMGVDILNPVQPECCDPFALKRDFGDRLTFHGATATQSLLVTGTPQQVRAHLRETVDLMSEGGGYIFAPSFTIIEGTPVENVLVFIEMLENLAI